MIPEARGILKLNPDPAFSDALDQLDGFSHIWIIFEFHQHLDQPWRPRINSPRVEAKKVGVFASRSPHRPNPIGMSVVRLESIDRSAKNGIEIHVSGVDILDGSPVLDIKPYLPYADSVPQAKAGWASDEITQYEVEFSPESLEVVGSFSSALFPNLKELIAEMLSFDPRPISQRKAMPLQDSGTEGGIFRFRISDFDVEWQVRAGKIYVLNLHRLKG